MKKPKLTKLSKKSVFIQTGFILLLFKINRLTQWNTIVICIPWCFLKAQGISSKFLDNKMLNNSIPYHKNLTERESTNQWQNP